MERPLLLICFFISFSISSAEFLANVGVNYGQLGNNLPTPPESVKLIQKLQAKRVKLYDATPKILEALRHTDIEVCIMVPNELINNISSNQTLANQWVHDMVVPFYPQTLIRYLLVGNRDVCTLEAIWAIAQPKSCYKNKMQLST